MRGARGNSRSYRDTDENPLTLAGLTDLERGIFGRIRLVYGALIGTQRNVTSQIPVSTC